VFPHLHQRLAQVQPLLDQLAVLLQEGAEEQAQVLDEVLLVVLAVGVGQPDVRVQGQHLKKEERRGREEVRKWVLCTTHSPGCPKKSFRTF